MIYDEDFFIKLKSKYRGKVGYLHGLAHNYTQCLGEIEKLNKLFLSLPKEMQGNEHLLNALKSERDETFRGAFGEMATAYILKYFNYAFEFEPKIAVPNTSKILTPDFKVHADENDFVVESFFTGPDETKKHYDKLYSQVAAELKGLQSDKFITMMGLPHPDKNGGFHGLKETVQDFLNSIQNPDHEITHSISSKNGAVILLKVSQSNEVREIGLSAVAGGFRGDGAATILQNAILKKIDKYRFPFTASCTSFVWDSAGYETLMKAMIGKPAMQVTVGPTSLEPVDTNTYDGVWGVLNRKLNKHLYLTGMLYTIISPKSDGLVLHVGYAKNPHLKDDSDIFSDVPDIMKFAQNGGDIGDFKPLKIEL